MMEEEVGCAEEDGKVTPFTQSLQEPGAADLDSVALDPKRRITCKLAEREVLTHNTRRLRFALPSPEQRFGLPVGKHVFVYARSAPPPTPEKGTKKNRGSCILEV